MEFRSIYTIITAENVPFKVELAGLASRLFAFLIDGLVMLTLTGALLLLVIFPRPSAWEVTEFQKTVIPLGLFLIFFGYHFFQEWLWNGRTLGKAILGLRVVRQDGQAIACWEALGRNLLRVVDVYLLGIGFICMMFHPLEKRFGDLLVGTIVIQDQSVHRSVYQPLEAGEPASVIPPEQGVARFLTAEEVELIQAFLDRQADLLHHSREILGAELCEYLSERLQQPVQTQADLQQLLQQYHAHQ